MHALKRHDDPERTRRALGGPHLWFLPLWGRGRGPFGSSHAIRDRVTGQTGTVGRTRVPPTLRGHALTLLRQIHHALLETSALAYAADARAFLKQNPKRRTDDRFCISLRPFEGDEDLTRYLIVLRA